MSTSAAQLLLASAVILNLTPHTLDVWTTNADGETEVVHFPSEGHDQVVRVSEEWDTTPIDRSGISLGFAKAYTGDVVNLPLPKEGTLLIVSRMVYDAVPDRTDLLAPYDFVRDPSGKIIGCRALLTRLL